MLQPTVRGHRQPPRGRGGLGAAQASPPTRSRTRSLVPAASHTGGQTTFDLDRFVADCHAALAERDDHRAVREVVARAVADPAGVLAGLGEPRRAQVQRLHHAPDLTILNVVWGAGMTVMPHNHAMWAIIGVYTGCEDNIFWRRIETERGPRIEAAGARALRVRDCAPLGRDIIHSVTNPIPRLTGAIHVYGGDFFKAARSEWDPETLCEERYSVEKAMRLSERSNTALAAAGR